MQAVTTKSLIQRASALLSDGTVCAVLGWKRGEFDYDMTPAVFTTPEELAENFVYNDFCGANLSKYLLKQTRALQGKILVFLKPCDTYSFNQLLTEHRFDRERVYAIGIPCSGMADIHTIRGLVGDGIASIRAEGDSLVVETLYDETKTIACADAFADRCKNCKSKKHVAYDELMGEEGDVLASNRFDQVEALEAMTPDERFAFWQGELSRCIRCNACRDACPACTCEKCVFDNPASGVENKAPGGDFEEKMFHIIRAFHVAGRCTDCGECSRACPQDIPLHLLNRKFILDINRTYGEYQAGEEVDQRSPLVNFNQNDPEPGEVVEGGSNHA